MRAQFAGGGSKFLPGAIPPSGQARCDPALSRPSCSQIDTSNRRLPILLRWNIRGLGPRAAAKAVSTPGSLWGADKTPVKNQRPERFRAGCPRPNIESPRDDLVISLEMQREMQQPRPCRANGWFTLDSETHSPF